MDASDEAIKPDMRARTYWLLVAAVVAVFVIVGEVLGRPRGTHWSERVLYNAGYAVGPLVFGGGLAFLLNRFGRRGGGPGFERPIAGMWWWTFWLAAFFMAAHLRAVFR